MKYPVMNLEKTLTASEIRSLNLSENDVMGYSYRNNGTERYPYHLVVNGNVVAQFSNSHDRKKSYDKIKRMGLCIGHSSGYISDEDLGLSLADPKGVFNYKIISR